MQITNQSGLAIQDHLAVGDFTAIRINDDLSWGQGAIRPQPAYNSAADHGALLEAVLRSIQPVTDIEQAYSSCTDGRLPVKLASGEPIPVREQMVGADMVSAFFVAEVLGGSFYKDTTVSVVERVNEVAMFLKENNFLPSSHIACGAAAGFVTILANITVFIKNPAFVERLQTLLPAVIQDEALQSQMLTRITDQLHAGAYDGLSAQAFLDTVQAVSGARAIAELHDDGRGVNGHVEEAIVRLKIEGFAINEARVAELTNGREVFGVNDNRIEKLARLFGRGQDNDYRLAYLALETFADAGHGTLAQNLPTWVITKA